MPKIEIPRDQLHPIDDHEEVGELNTFNFLNERLVNYREKKAALEEALNEEARAHQRVISAQMDFRWAKDGLTTAVHQASNVIKSDEDAKHSLETSAPPIEIPLPPGATFPHTAESDEPKEDPAYIPF